MKKLNIYRYTQCYVMIILGAATISGQDLYQNVGHINPDYQAEWHLAGLQETIAKKANRRIDITTVAGNSWDEKVTSVLNDISSTNDLVVIFFPKGFYEFKNKILVAVGATRKGNIIFQGEGSESVLYFNTNPSSPCFYIIGSMPHNTVVNISQDIKKGTRRLTADSGAFSEYKTGEWVHYYLEDFLDNGNFPSNSFNFSIGQVSRIDSVGPEADILYLRDPASIHYSTENLTTPLRARLMRPVQNIGIENLQILRRPSFSQSAESNIVFYFAANCWIRGIESMSTFKHHLQLNWSDHIEISGNYFDNAVSHDNGGFGYGVDLQHSTNYCLVENNIFYFLRHAMIVHKGANSNVFSYNYSHKQYSEWAGVPYKDSDVTLHGFYPFANLFEHNTVDWIEADKERGHNGPYNAFVRNKVKRTDNRYIQIDHKTPYTSVLGCNLASFNPISAENEDNVVLDLYGIWGNNYETGSVYPHIMKNWFPDDNIYLNDNSYYYSEAPDFVEELTRLDITFPSIGPKSDGLEYVNEHIPAEHRYVYGPLAWNNKPTVDAPPPVPLQVVVSGPNNLMPTIKGIFRANPSGGNSKYVNYKWWRRVTSSKSGGDFYTTRTLAKKPSEPVDKWQYLSELEGEKTVTQSGYASFELKCEVEDSESEKASTTHFVQVGHSRLNKLKNAATSAIPKRFEYNGNYPNPFNPTTTISF